MENGPRPVSARPLPRAWARGPAADDRAAESARRGAPRAPSWASSGPRCCRPFPAVDLHEARSDGQPRISREQNFGRRRVPNPSAISCLLPLLSREERRPWVAPCRVLAAGIPCRGNRAATPPLDSVGRGERRHGHRVHRRDRDLAHATVAGVRTGGGTR